MKFFDLRLRFVSKEERHQLAVTNQTELEHQEKNYILAPVLQAIKEGYKVEVLKTLKANGENVQISYIQDSYGDTNLNCWTICSKNVGILVRSVEDVKLFEGEERYSFACEMAKVWFKQLSQFTPEQTQQLLADLNGRTMVGEYIGSQDHQHLVKYSRVSIIFYAIISNASPDICWPCEAAWALFKKYGLDVVQISSLGVFNNYGALCDQLEHTFKEVAKSTIAQDEEGNVLYFIKKDPNAKDMVLSLAKLKTLEYRLFRKMREKLRNFYNSAKKENTQIQHLSKYKFDEIAKKFHKEASELLENGQNQLPKPLEYYDKVF